MLPRSPLESLASRPHLHGLRSDFRPHLHGLRSASRRLLHGFFSSKKSTKQHSLSLSVIVSRIQISEPVGLTQAAIFSVELRC